MIKISAILSVLLMFSFFLRSCSEVTILYERINAEPSGEEYIIQNEKLKKDFFRKFYMAVFIGKHTVLIYDEAIFQSCHGYPVNNGKKYSGGKVYVGYGFDSGIINLRQTNTYNIYPFNAGL
ncbi:MAG: hypothetical protein K2G83_05270 [Ruminococcus sp.]|nr:hypothetical protein [Ruminococcus sp.]